MAAPPEGQRVGRLQTPACMAALGDVCMACCGYGIARPHQKTLTPGPGDAHGSTLACPDGTKKKGGTQRPGSGKCSQRNAEWARPKATRPSGGSWRAREKTTSGNNMGASPGCGMHGRPCALNANAVLQSGPDSGLSGTREKRDQAHCGALAARGPSLAPEMRRQAPTDTVYGFACCEAPSGPVLAFSGNHPVQTGRRMPSR